MFTLLHWLPATTGSVVVAMVVASLLPMLWMYIAKWLAGFQLHNNQAPRDFMMQATGAAARARAAEQNSYETLPLFLAAAVLALVYFVPLSVVSVLVWLYVLLRVLYGLAYIANWAFFRSAVWALGLACPLLLMYLVYRMS